MLLTNKEIYFNAKNLIDNFNEEEKEKLPLKIAFCISKNKKILQNLSEEIEKERVNILKKKGTYNKEDDCFHYTDEDKDFVNNELQDLLDLKQEVNIMTLTYNDLEKKNINLTIAQMDAIMFMIEDGAEEKPQD